MQKATSLPVPLAVVGLIFATAVSAGANDKTHEMSSEAANQTLLRLLFDPAYNAIKDYYGEPRQYWEDEILSVQEVPTSEYYEVVLQVETFYGPHNPPYGIETMTFYVSYSKVELEKIRTSG